METHSRFLQACDQACDQACERGSFNAALTAGTSVVLRVPGALIVARIGGCCGAEKAAFCKDRRRSHWFAISEFAGGVDGFNAGGLLVGAWRDSGDGAREAGIFCRGDAGALGGAGCERTVSAEAPEVAASHAFYRVARVGRSRGARTTAGGAGTERGARRKKTEGPRRAGKLPVRGKKASVQGHGFLLAA